MMHSCDFLGGSNQSSNFTMNHADVLATKTVDRTMNFEWIKVGFGSNTGT